MDKERRVKTQALFLKTSNLKNSRILQRQFNNVKLALADEVLYGNSPLGLPLFNILLHINPLNAYFLPSSSLLLFLFS